MQVPMTGVKREIKPDKANGVTVEQVWCNTIYHMCHEYEYSLQRCCIFYFQVQYDHFT